MRKKRDNRPTDPTQDPVAMADIGALMDLVQRGVERNPSTDCRWQRSLEEAMKAFTMWSTWRVGWITPMALDEINQTRGVWKTCPLRRCHGAYPGYLSRTDRFKKLLLMKGDPKDAWEFFLRHDRAVLAHKREHKKSKVWLPSEVVVVPEPSPGERPLFFEDGYSTGVKEAELAWVDQVIATPVSMNPNHFRHLRKSAPVPCK